MHTPHSEGRTYLRYPNNDLSPRFYTVHAHPHVTISLPGHECVRGIFQLVRTEVNIQRKLQPGEFGAMQFQPQPCMSLMPCSGRAYQAPYQDRS
jgi:hypothetical protein